MRQKKATSVTVAISALFVLALVVYGLVRSRHGHERSYVPERPQYDEHMHEHSRAHGHCGELQPSGKIVEGIRVVKIVARQFEFDPSIIVVKQSEKVRLEVTSEDVTHGIAIENYDIDRRLGPQKTELITFTADKPGRHHFHCSVYCGAGHVDMHGELVVIEESE